MKMAGKVTVSCVALALVLNSASAVKRLNSMDDLREVYSDKDMLGQCLVLLYWFANTIDIGSSDVRLTFNPNNRDYGSHHYGNFQQLLPQGHQYYTVGNLNQHNLPRYVFNHITPGTAGNRARIIIGVEGSNRGAQIHAVYITQHYENFGETRYDPQHTYEISIHLLREIRRFSVSNDRWSLGRLRDQYASNINDYQFNDILNTLVDLAGLGLLLFIVTQTYYSKQPHFTQRLRDNTCCKLLCFLLLMFLLFIFLILVNSPSSLQTNRRWN